MAVLGASGFVAISAAASLGLVDPLLRFVQSVPGRDTVGHLLLIGGLAFVATLTLVDPRNPVSSRRWVRMILGLGLMVTLDEGLQLWLPRRSFSWADLGANYLGIVLFSGLAVTAHRRFVLHSDQRETMPSEDTRSEFEARLLRPRVPGPEDAWAFVVLPPEASAKLPRRGRTSVEAILNGHRFTTRLEPDGQKSHWMRIDEEQVTRSGASVGEVARFEIEAVEQEPEPEPPEDLSEALASSPEARTTWEATTTLARVDWIHWIVSAKQAATRAKRIRDACEQLAVGKKRVCCFDSSGFYSKAFRAPEAES